jgi:hypothetical protein
MVLFEVVTAGDEQNPDFTRGAVWLCGLKDHGEQQDDNQPKEEG